MELRTFKKEDYELLIGWIDSAKLNYQWGGSSFQFPLDSVQIDQHCSQPEVFPFIFTVSGLSAGYVELFKVSESHFRICRVLISNNFRGQGISKLMLGQLIELAEEKYGARSLSLAVFKRNIVAKTAMNRWVSKWLPLKMALAFLKVSFGGFYIWKSAYTQVTPIAVFITRGILV